MDDDARTMLMLSFFGDTGMRSKGLPHDGRRRTIPRRARFSTRESFRRWVNARDRKKNWIFSQNAMLRERCFFKFYLRFGSDGVCRRMNASGRGNQIVQVEVRVPEHITDKQRHLLEEFKAEEKLPKTTRACAAEALRRLGRFFGAGK